MQVNLDFDLLLYGVVLAVLGVLAHRLAPDLGHATLVTGVAGGAVAVLWGVLGLRGFRRRTWVISTLAVVVIVLGIQAVRAWLEFKSGNEAIQPAAALLTLLLVIGAGQLVNFAQANRLKR